MSRDLPPSHNIKGSSQASPRNNLKRVSGGRVVEGFKRVFRGGNRGSSPTRSNPKYGGHSDETNQGNEIVLCNPGAPQQVHDNWHSAQGSERLSEGVRRLEDDNEALKDQLQKLKDQLHALQANVTDKDLEIHVTERKLEDSEVAGRNLEEYCKQKDDALAKATKKLKSLEKQLQALHQRNGTLPSLDIATGSYELGGANPESIQIGWQNIYKSLRRTCFRFFKHPDRSNTSSKAFDGCQMLAKFGTMNVSVNRAEATFVVRKVVWAMFPILGVISMGTVKNREPPFIAISPIYFPRTGEDNPEISKIVLRTLPKPNLDDESFNPRNAFETLTKKYPTCVAYENLWVRAYNTVRAVLLEYDISDIDDFIENLVYAFIYIKFQMVAIGDDNVVPYAAGTVEDFEGRHSPGYSILRNDNFYESAINIDFDPGETGIQEGTLAFTTFPGIGYWNAQDGEWKVISKCKVATYELSNRNSDAKG